MIIYVYDYLSIYIYMVCSDLTGNLLLVCNRDNFYWYKLIGEDGDLNDIHRVFPRMIGICGVSINGGVPQMDYQWFMMVNNGCWLIMVNLGMS